MNNYITANKTPKITSRGRHNWARSMALLKFEGERAVDSDVIEACVAKFCGVKLVVAAVNGSCLRPPVDPTGVRVVDGLEVDLKAVVLVRPVKKILVHCWDF